jgi:phosphoglycolate phosphatase-like HAD superfamily hydrolase
MVGDSPSDIEAGKIAGCRTALIASSHLVRSVEPEADIVEGSLISAVHEILQFERREQFNSQQNLLDKTQLTRSDPKE